MGDFMEVTRRSSYGCEKLYFIDDSKILAQRDSWELWKKKRGSWELVEQVKKKDYDEYTKKRNLTSKDFYTFENEFFTVTSLLDLEEVDKEEKRLIKRYNKLLNKKAQEEKSATLRNGEVQELIFKCIKIFRG